MGLEVNRRKSEKHSNLFAMDILKHSGITKPILIDVAAICCNCGMSQIATIERGQSLYQKSCERCNVTSLRVSI